MSSISMYLTYLIVLYKYGHSVDTPGSDSLLGFQAILQDIDLAREWDTDSVFSEAWSWGHDWRM